MTDTHTHIPELVLNISRSFKYAILISGSFLSGFMIYKTNIFAQPKPSVSDWFLFVFWTLILIFPYLLLLVKYKVVINDNGIFRETRFLGYNRNKLLKWQEVDTCYLSDQSSRGIQDLILNFTLKNTGKIFKLGLSGFDKSEREINNIVQSYSMKYKFGFLGLDDE